MRRFLSTVLALYIATQLLVASTEINPKLFTENRRIRTVFLLHPTAQMTALGAFKDDIKEKEAGPIADAVEVLVSGALKKRGWNVIDVASFNQALGNKEELKYLIEYLRSTHQKLVGEFRPKDVTRGRYTLGSRVAAIGSQSRADVLVLVNADATRTTAAGKAVPYVITGGLYGVVGLGTTAILDLLLKYKMPLDISIVDAQTGEILSYSRTVRKKKDTRGT